MMLGKEVHETKHGRAELTDFNSLFGYNVKIPCETIGRFKKQSREEIKEEHPLYKAFMENTGVFSKYLKAHGSGVDVDSYRIRIPHIEAMKKILEITSRLQFVTAFEDQANLYITDNLGWGLLKVVPTYKDSKLVSTEVFIGDEKLDLSKPVRVNAISWYGQMLEGYHLADANGGDGTTEPINLVLKLNNDSLGRRDVTERADKMHGALNHGNIQDTMVESPLSYFMFRISRPEDEENMDINPTGYETPIFAELDYSYEIGFESYAKYAERYHTLKDQDLFSNSREFSMLNLFRWGVMDKAAWERGTAIFDAIDNAKRYNDRQTLIDEKIFRWGMEKVTKLQRTSKSSRDVTDEVIIAGSEISKLASMMSQAYLIITALVVDQVTADDLTFRETRIALQSKPETTSRFQSIRRLNPDTYKFVELDKDDNMIGLIAPIDVMAIVNYDINAIVVSFDGMESETNKKYVDFYQAIQNYQPTLVEVTGQA